MSKFKKDLPLCRIFWPFVVWPFVVWPCVVWLFVGKSNFYQLNLKQIEEFKGSMTNLKLIFFLINVLMTPWTNNIIKVLWYQRKLLVTKQSWIQRYSTGCPKKHGNSVTNSISSFQIILWFSIMIPTEKAVICKSFVCYVHILFVYVLTAYGCTS